MTANYIRTLNIDEPLARITANGLRFYQTDALGSVIGLVDDTGAVKTTYTYDPFGNVTISGEPSDNPFQYTGRENDNTELYYYRARYYSPELQRFISEDPLNIKKVIFLKQRSSKRVKDTAEGVFNYALTYPQVLNEFAYTINNPVNYIDPLGLIPPRGFTPSPGGAGSTIVGAVCATLAGAGGYAVGGPVGGVIAGLAGGWYCRQLLSPFEDPCAGLLNCNEPFRPEPYRDPYCPPGNDWCCN